MLKFGKIAVVDVNKGMYRVNFDEDDLLSAPIPRVSMFTKFHKSEVPFVVDEHVACLMDENCEYGVILGAIFSDVDQPAVKNSSVISLKFIDGVLIQYNFATSELKVDGKCAVTINTTKKVTVTTTSNVEATCNQFKVTGNVQVTGNITLSGALQAGADVRASNGAVGLLTHTHVETGGTTAPGLG